MYLYILSAERIECGESENARNTATLASFLNYDEKTGRVCEVTKCRGCWKDLKTGEVTEEASIRSYAAFVVGSHYNIDGLIASYALLFKQQAFLKSVDGAGYIVLPDGSESAIGRMVSNVLDTDECYTELDSGIRFTFRK